MNTPPRTLAAILREERAESLIRQAETIRDYPEERERINEAEGHVREAMLQHALGNITSAEQYSIFSILSFVMPADAPTQGEEPPGT